MKNLKRSSLFAAALGFTLLINAFIFFGIPFLSEVRAKRGHEDFNSFVSFKMTKPIIEERKKEKKKPEKEKKPEKLQKTKLRHKPQNTKKPKLDVKLPKMQFEMNSRLAEGMSVSLPETDIQGSVGGSGFTKAEFEMSEVDNPPKVVYKTVPVYPYTAKRRHITGKVVLRFLVDKSGVVSRIKVVESEPSGVFDKAATDAISRWKFKPGIFEGKPVSTWIVAPFDFRM